jgi:hypothetical protein
MTPMLDVLILLGIGFTVPAETCAQKVTALPV